jgi:sigma-B regulation protein RsbU (phosphoserine phosphatase)
MIIGVMEDVPFSTKRHVVDGLGKLYLFSDGIYEVSSASGTILPFQEFVGFLLRSHAQTPSSLDATLSEIRRSTPRDYFDDDVSIVEVVFGTDGAGARSAQRPM